MVLSTWYSQIKEADALYDKLTDDQLKNEVAPNRNTGMYLLGHMVAVHDRMLPLLSFGDRLYPHLDKGYITDPDKTGTQTAAASDLRAEWKNINSILAGHFNNLKTEEWFERHNSVSPEDFAKEPHRNKLNVVLNRANHLSYHLGQMIFLKK
jgi:hypothetical protein